MSNAPLALLMGGGVMPGRGVDQLLHQPFLSTLHKNWGVRSFDTSPLWH